MRRLWFSSAVTVLVVGFSLPSLASPSQFLVARNFPAGNFPFSAVVADFNNDGKLDVALVNLVRNDVIVSLNDGNGRFQAPAQFRTGIVSPTVVEVADLNQDGKLDLVVFNDPVDGSNADFSVLLGNGDGTFQSPQTGTIGSFPTVVVFADFNSDGKLDMVAADPGNQDPFGPASLLLLLGNGDGTFQAGQEILAGSTPQWVAVGDFNNDGNADLAVANLSPNSVSILLGTGKGKFQAPKTVTGVGSPLFVAAQEMDTDNKLDLVVSNSDNAVAVVKGNGDGTFQPAKTFPAGIGPSLLVLGDFNGDRKTDVAAMAMGGGPVSVMLGNGDDTLRIPSLYDAGQAVSWLAAGDITGNRKLDLITVNSVKAGSLTFLQGRGDGTFVAARDYPTLAGPGNGVKGDFNGDGNEDLVFLGSFPGVLSVLLGNGNGTFRPPKNTPLPNSNAIAAGDFNHDGKLDLAITDTDHSSVDILLGNGDGTFQNPVEYPVVSGFPFNLALADFNNDGNLDIVVAVGLPGEGGNVNLLLGNGDGSFKPATQIPFNGASQIVTGDFNRDGNQDFIALQAPFTNLTMYLGKGDGTFQSPVNLPPNGGGFAQAVDINGDHKLDLVIGIQGGSEFNQFGLNVMLGNGDGTFQNAVFTPLPLLNPPFFVSADFNRDGNLDFVASSFADSTVALALGNGKGGFQTPVSFPVASFPGGLVEGQYTNSQTSDLAVGISGQAGTSDTGSVTVLLNTGSH